MPGCADRLAPPAEGERRIHAIVGPAVPIRTAHATVRGLAERRLGQVDVLKVIELWAGSPLDHLRARWAIGVSRDGQLMVTADLNPGRHLEWVAWAGMLSASA